MAVATTNGLGQRNRLLLQRVVIYAVLILVALLFLGHSK